MKVYTDLHNRTKNYSLTQNTIFMLKESYGIEVVTKFDESVEIYWGDKFKMEHLKYMPNIKWIHLSKTGVDNFKFPANVVVTNTPSSSIGVDEYALSIVMYFLRSIDKIEKLRNTHSLDRASFDKFISNTKLFKDTSCLIVGMGTVGMGLYKMLDSLKFKVEGVDKYKFVKLDTLVTSFDFVINCLPLNNDTRMVFNKSIFSNMKPSSVFINVGRGETVNESDLLEALTNNKIRAAFLDVVCEEPINQNSNLLKFENLFISPHIANATSHILEIQINEFVKNFKKYKKNKPLNNVIKLW